MNEWPGYQERLENGDCEDEPLKMNGVVVAVRHSGWLCYSHVFEQGSMKCKLCGMDARDAAMEKAWESIR